jgi:tryptophanase
MLRSNDLHRAACRLCVLTRGFQMTYGSLPGRDLEAIAVGVQEVMDETYLAQRADMISRLAAALEAGGVRIVRPAGGHAVFIDAADFCAHLATRSIDSACTPSHALACALYEHAGIRCTPIGSVLVDRREGASARPMDLVRLAIPRRLHTQAQLEYVASSVVALRSAAEAIRGRPVPHDLDAPVMARPLSSERNAPARAGVV